MEPIKPALKIAIFVAAVVCTAGLAYAAVKGMQWALAYTSSVAQGDVHPMLKTGGALFVGVIVALRFYLRRRAKLAQKNTEN